MALLIRDGYTLTGRIPAQSPWPEVVFQFRPALPEEVVEYIQGAPSRKPKAHVEAQVKLLASHLVSWDVKEADGSPAAINEKTLRCLPYPILVAMLNHIQGYAESEASEDAKN